ncbi:hypothetical protein PDE_04139 [Penicillium oxalicum 114-2]|uniref:Zn(2)-C6 fungal-type domain-containing protein n=1 Tax=Penicillium oxalicum (strain 114-2 / CGMCC 5302) TaxID=933388 RepID=S7ZEU4_PENO1|nr:hypothetical protein PDE_04139 [Penicillium oxalicum 114-2]
MHAARRTPELSRETSPASLKYNPRKRGRTACTRCKTRKQKCDNEYPSCSNCQKAGVTCDKLSVRDDADRQDEYTRALEQRIALLEKQLQENSQSRPSRNHVRTDDTPINVMQPGRPSRDGPTNNQVNPAAVAGLENNPVGEIVGLLALSSSEAPAYVGSSSGLALAANLGEMVQTSVWNQFISNVQSQRQTPGEFSGNAQGNLSSRPGPPQSGAGLGASCTDRTNMDPPNDEMGSKLLETYFRRLHLRYPFLDRSQIWSSHEDRWRLAKIKREDLTQSDRAAIFKLNMAYAIGATMLQLTEKYAYTAPEKFYAAALQHAPSMCEARSIENIEAMVLLVIYHLRTASSHGMWYMIGLAMRTAIDLGLHRKANEANMDLYTAQLRRRLFWVIYYLERVVAMSLGRPFSISDRHIDLDLPLDVDDDIRDPELLAAPIDPNKSSSLTFGIYLVKLRRIDSRIQHKIYRADRPLPSLRPKMDHLYRELEQWKESAAQRFSGADLEYPMLHYNRAVRFLIQPFLPLLPITDPYYHICIRAAGEICQSHKRLHQTLEYGHSFLAVQTVFMAGITLLYALWTHTDQVWSVRMSNDIRACSTVLFVMSERAAWVKRFRDAFELLVNAAMEKLQGDETARNAGMAELMAAQQGTSKPGVGNASSWGSYPVRMPPAGLESTVSTSMYSTDPVDENEHAVRVAMQLAPWIDQHQSDPLWMPDFETLESLSGGYWTGADLNFFDTL